MEEMITISLESLKVMIEKSYMDGALAGIEKSIIDLNKRGMLVKSPGYEELTKEYADNRREQLARE
jgi:hypothetical protein